MTLKKKKKKKMNKKKNKERLNKIKLVPRELQRSFY